MRTGIGVALTVASILVASCASGSGPHNNAGATASPSPSTTLECPLFQTCKGGPTDAGNTSQLAFHSEVSANAPIGSQTVALIGLQFQPATITVSGKKAVFYLTNQETTPHPGYTNCNYPSFDTCYSHAMAILSADGRKVIASSATVHPGYSEVFVVENLPAGTYRFFCPLNEHPSQGMTGALSVP
jgi:uncharacterized cupredoxin-like copper-binding protein